MQHERYTDFFELNENVDKFGLETLLTHLEFISEEGEEGEIKFLNKKSYVLTLRTPGKISIKAKITVQKDGQIRINILPDKEDI